MKKSIFALLVLFSFPSFAQSTPLEICKGSDTQIIPLPNRQDKSTLVQPFINNYKNYYRPSADRYELCFSYTNSDSDKHITYLTASLAEPSGADKPIVISGLNVEWKSGNSQTIPLFVANYSTPLIIHNSTFKCLNKTNTIGIQLNGDGHQIQNNEIQNCSVGIQVGDAQSTGNNMNIGPANKIHDNNTGVKIANGSGNFVERNKIYLNDANGDGKYEQTEGILLTDGANNSILPPAILNTSGNVVQQPNEPILTYSAGVTELPSDDQPPVIATFQINPPYPARKVEVNLIDQVLYESVPDNKIFQGNQFFINIDHTDVDCTVSKSQYTCQVPMTMDKKDQLALILFHDPVFGSTTYSQRVKLNGPPGPFTPPVSGSAPTTGGMTGGGNFGASTDGGGSASLPEAGNATATTSASGATGGSSGGGSGAVTVAGAGGGGGGMGSCGASLNQTNHGAISGILLLEVTALLLLVRWRRKQPQEVIHDDTTHQRSQNNKRGP